MSTVNISALTAATASNLTGAAIVPTTDSTVTTVGATLAQLRTKMFAGGSGYTASDPITGGAASFTTGAFSGSISGTASANNFGSPTGASAVTFGTASPSGNQAGQWNLINSNTQINWQISTNSYTAGGTFAITPSTVAGGATFTTPVFSISPAGVSSFGSNAVSMGALTATTGTFSGAFGCNTKTAQTAYASGGSVVTTTPALASYGYTLAQATAILTLLNNIQAALVANGIMS